MLNFNMEGFTNDLDKYNKSLKTLQSDIGLNTAKGMYKTMQDYTDEDALYTSIKNSS